jgi:hypothetical protein
VVVTEEGVETEWGIAILALTNGYIISTNNVGITEGGHAVFAVTPCTYYHTTNVFTNGSALDAAPYITPCTFTWSNVTADGVIQAFFAPDMTTNTHTPAWWLARYYGATNFEEAALADTDKDGLRAWEEEVAGTVPTNAGSTFGCTLVEAVGNAWVIQWPSVTGRVYDIDVTTNLLNGDAWRLKATNVTATPSLNTYTIHVDNVGIQTFRTRVHKDE